MLDQQTVDDLEIFRDELSAAIEKGSASNPLHFPHAELKYIFHKYQNLIQKCIQLKDNETIKALCKCIDVIWSADSVCASAYGKVMIGNLLDLMRFVLNAARKSLPVTIETIKKHPAVIFTYYAYAYKLPTLRVLVVVVNYDRVDLHQPLPNTLSDGTHVHTIISGEKVNQPRRNPKPWLAGYIEHKRKHDEIIQALLPSLAVRSNVISVTSTFMNSEWCIEIGVVCKGLIPVCDTIIAKNINGVRIVISEADVFYCGTKKLRWKTMDTVQPGCAIAPLPFAHLSATATMATLSGFAVYHNQMYAFTSGHLFDDSNNTMLAMGTPISQSCGLAHLFNYLTEGENVENPCVLFETTLADVSYNRNKQLALLLNNSNMSVDEFNNSNNNNLIGSLINTVRNSTVDCAIFSIDQAMSAQYITSGVFSKFLGAYDAKALIDLNNTKDTCWEQHDFCDYFRAGNRMKCYSYGARSGALSGEVLCDTAIYRDIVNGSLRTDLINTNLPGDRGDSGALVWTSWDENPLIFGMIVERYTVGDFLGVVVLPIWHILEFLKRNIVTSDNTHI